MSEAFIGEVRIFSYPFAPKNWALCNGQLLAIQQNQALFSLLGTTYGGNGIQTFALPNLQGAVSIGFASSYPQGAIGGEAAHTLTIQEIPLHSHAPIASNAPGTQLDPGGALSAMDPNGGSMFGSSPDVLLSPSAVAVAGSSQPHQNMMPFQVMNFCIALFGIFPSRN